MANTVTTQDREIKHLNVLVQVQLNRALKEIKAKGINPLVVETLRSKERQYYLYCQGRTAAEANKAGVPASYAKKYANPTASKVTWTLNSIHIQGCAVDVIPQRKVNGKMTAIWNSQDKETKQIISIMEKYGFEPGANWKTSPDSPHFQVKGCRGTTYSASNTTKWVTKMIQFHLKAKGYSLTIDGIWGAKTTAAVNKFRKKCGWKENGKLGKNAIKVLIA
ncbi:MAG: hypothetical protein HDT30_00925 [Clostridiales bacterium]|nr:hypothetical protein [Clostridiales bacterium]